MNEELLAILQSIALELSALKTAVKALQDSTGKPVEPSPSPAPTPSWVDVFRSSWGKPASSEWPNSWGSWPFDDQGNPVGIRIPVSASDPGQTALVRNLARWGFGPTGNVAVWSKAERDQIWKRMEFLFRMTEEEWNASEFAKLNVEPDLIAFLTCLNQFNPEDPYDGLHFGTSSNRLDHLEDKSFSGYLKSSYFNKPSGGTPSGNEG